MTTFDMQRSTIDKVIDTMELSASGVVGPDLSGIQQEFRRAVERTPGFSLLLLTTADGRAVAEWTSLRTDARRLAAMTNSFLTLGETVAKELGMASADYAAICTRQGNMVLIRIDGLRPMTLAALGTLDTNMAVLLFAARECALRLQLLLRSDS